MEDVRLLLEPIGLLLKISSPLAILKYSGRDVAGFIKPSELTTFVAALIVSVLMVAVMIAPVPIIDVVDPM